MNRIKNSFTLIELLIVVAIIGILAGVGIPMYNGYMTKVKIESTIANRVQVKNFIIASFIKCSGGSTSISLPNYKTIPCSTSPYQMGIEFAKYFYYAGFKNPYGQPDWNQMHQYNNDNGVVEGGYVTPPLGVVQIRGSGSKVKNNQIIRMNTSIGDESGGNNLIMEEFLIYELIWYRTN